MNEKLSARFEYEEGKRMIERALRRDPTLATEAQDIFDIFFDARVCSEVQRMIAGSVDPACLHAAEVKP